VGCSSRPRNGSMRDALSLTDRLSPLGMAPCRLPMCVDARTIDHGRCLACWKPWPPNDAPPFLGQWRSWQAGCPISAGVFGRGDFQPCSRVAIAQRIATAANNSLGDQARVLADCRALERRRCTTVFISWAARRRDLPLAPDPRVVFEMALLRNAGVSAGDCRVRGHFRLASAHAETIQPIVGAAGKVIGLSQPRLTPRLAIRRQA